MVHGAKARCVIMVHGTWPERERGHAGATFVLLNHEVFVVAVPKLNLKFLITEKSSHMI